MNLLETTIGWLAPAECIICGHEGVAICEICETAEILAHTERCGFCGVLSPRSRTCRRCQKTATPRHVWISTDYDGAAKKLAQAYKFGHLRAAVLPMARIMCDTLLYGNNQQDLTRANYLVVPIPTASSRRRQRGFDQTFLLARAISRRLGLPYCPALSRLGQSRQVGAPRRDRLTQLSGHYIARSSFLVANRNILLIDDVLTTGGTVRAATQALRQAGAKRVDALVFAKRL